MGRRITLEQAEDVLRLKALGLTMREIARRVGLSRGTVESVCKGTWFQIKPRKIPKVAPHNRVKDPTPEEIEARKQEVLRKRLTISDPKRLTPERLRDAEYLLGEKAVSD